MRRVYPTVRILATAIALAAASCGPATPPPAAPAVDLARGETPVATGPLVVFLGDSLTAGYGLSEDQAFPALLGAALNAEGLPVRVVNAGVSGDTSAGGLARLDWVLDRKPDVLVVGLGANDALRGQPLDALETNLRAIVGRARAAGVRVLLLGMRIPTNYGPDYANGFADVYTRLARELDVPLVPFLLERVGGRSDLNLPDGLHPNVEGHKIVAANVRPYLETVVRSLGRKG